MKHKLFAIFSYLIFYATFSQNCPDTSFSLADNTICTNEILDIQNFSSNIDAFEWDFCSGDLKNTPTLKTIVSNTSLNQSWKMTIENDNGNWVGFATGRSAVGDKVIKMSFGNSLTNNPVLQQISVTGLNDPNAIDLIKIGESWFGLIGNYSSSDLIILRFGSSLNSIPITSVLPNILPTAAITDIELFMDGDNLYGYVINQSNNQITLLNFGSSVLNIPTVSSQSISLGSNFTDLAIIKNCENFYGLVTSYNDRKVIFLSFGNDLKTIQTSSQLTFGNINFNRPTSCALIHEGNGYYGFVQDLFGNIIRIDFGEEMISNPSAFNLGNLGSLNFVSAFTLKNIDSDYYGFSVGLNSNTLFRLDFSEPCWSSQQTSNDPIPKVYYKNDGEYLITLKGMNSLGDFNYHNQLITVFTDVAPEINLLADTNQCATTSSSFTPSTTGLTYSWDFDEDGIEDSNLENPSFAFGTPGTYTVRLDVDDGTCHNFTTQDITLYEEPPVPAFTVTGDLCTTSSLTFGNTTTDAAYAGPLSYAWDFNGEGSSSVKSPSFAFATPGTKTVTLTSSIPGCENVTQQVIEVLAGPMAAFSSNASCQGGLMSFTNNSAGADTYLWDFGDGFTSTQANPGHVYTSGGNYTVTLSATETGACTTILQQQVSVAYLPSVEFDYDVPCSGSQGIDFYDFSFAAGADIVAWSWYVDDVFVTSEREPTISFDEAGTHDIRLEVLSSRGCSSSLEKSIEVLGAPVPSFSAEVNCQSQTSFFTDTTPGTVISRLWSINGQTYTTANPSHVFASAGNFNVSLTVTSSDFCTSTTSSVVTVRPAPVMSFGLSSYCSGDEILITDNSTSADPIVSRTWSLDGTPFFNGAQALLSGASSGPHTLSLQVQTSTGCTFSKTQNITLFPSPTAGFTPSATYGVPPFSVTFTNTSTGATSYQWKVNGVDAGTSANLTRVFTQAGNQEVTLIATNAENCESITSTTISSIIPAVDLQVREVTVFANGSSQNISVTIRNNGNFPIENFDVLVRSGNDAPETRTFTDFIGIGEEVSVGFVSALPTSTSNRLCVSVVTSFEDIQPDDNDACVTNSTIILENPYPNPIYDEAIFRLILPSEKSVQLSITDISGKTIINEQLSNLSAGLHVLRYDASQWKKGIYLVTVQSGGVVVSKKVVK